MTDKELTAKIEAVNKDMTEEHQIGELLYRAHRYDDKPHQIYSHIMVMAKGHPDEAEIRRLMDLRYNGCHDEKQDAEALRALAAWSAEDVRSVGFGKHPDGWYVWLYEYEERVIERVSGATLAAAIMDAISKAKS